MTSLELFNHPNRNMGKEPPDWGTGREGNAPRENMWVPKPPTWHYSGEPIEQHYSLTKLKLSNVRLNDQLQPSPQHCTMGDLMIQRPFPAEHPFASHIPRYAVFPTFESASDPKRGVEARECLPKNAEMPSQPFDYVVISQTKGSGMRREAQALPSESNKLPLEWKSHDFDQIPKSPWNAKQDFYPIPPKLFMPSNQKRSDSKCVRGNMEVGPLTADTMKNVERNQWQTTYDLNHTGLGPSNPLRLDNLQSKTDRLSGDDNLEPCSVNTFNPPRPVEGRIARKLVPPPDPQTDQFPNPPSDPTYRRKLTLAEKEEDRLWNGQQYHSHPDVEKPGNKHSDLQWRLLQSESHPEPGLATLSACKGAPDSVPHKAQGAPEPEEEGHMEELARKKYVDLQQMEAADRWKVLEGVTPADDITRLNQKLELVSSKTHPHVFYDHEGKYQEERAGLYKTSYDPGILQHAMNREEKTGSRAVDVSDLHVGALDLPLDLNQDMASAIRCNRTLGGPPGSVPQLHDQPSQYETFGTFDKTRSLQKAKLQPCSQTAAVRTQEGCVNLKESTYGGSYNTQKFLQENSLPPSARYEPTTLMSKDNQDLNNVRLTATPSQGVPSIRRPMIPYEKELPNLLRPESAPELGEQSFGGRYSYQMKPESATLETNRVMAPTHYPNVPVPLTKSRQYTPQYKQDALNQLASKSTNFGPAMEGSWGYKTAYQNQFPTYYSLDMTYKNDERFNWKPGSGMPRPQTSLLAIQNSFSKSCTRKEFHQKFPESCPDLRENIIAGKKHTFGSVNAQVLRGTPIVPVA